MLRRLRVPRFDVVGALDRPPLRSEAVIADHCLGAADNDRLFVCHGPPPLPPPSRLRRDGRTLPAASCLLTPRTRARRTSRDTHLGIAECRAAHDSYGWAARILTPADSSSECPGVPGNTRKSPIFPGFPTAAMIADPRPSWGGHPAAHS
jgi:hypothetical protein